MTRHRINGVGYNIETWGSGAPLVALHGFTGSVATWEPLAQAIGDEYEVIGIDMLGHGLSDSPSNPRRYSMERTVEDITAILDRLAIQQTGMLGYSMGGRIALSYAIAMPERIRALVLESASAGLASALERQQRMASDERLAQLAEREGIIPFVDYWESIPLWESQKQLSAEVRASLREQRLRNNVTGLANSLRGIGTGAQPPVHDNLGKLSMPVCFIAGEEDVKYVEAAQEMARAVKCYQTVIIPRAGHAAHLEQPQLFQQAVQQFLRVHLGARAEI